MEDLEPGELRLDDMLKKPKSKNQAVLYKMVSPVAGKGKNSRKQTIEVRSNLSNDEDIADSSGQEDSVVVVDSDQASTSGTQFAVPKTPPKRGKRQPAAAAVAAGAAAKKRAAEEEAKEIQKTKKMSKTKPVVNQDDGDDESDDESIQPSGNEDGDESETQTNPPPAKKKKRTYTPRVPKEVKRASNPKGEHFLLFNSWWISFHYLVLDEFIFIILINLLNFRS